MTAHTPAAAARGSARGLIYPGSFLAEAEAAGLIERMTVWILDAVCRQIADWRRGGLVLQRLSVNISAQHLASGNLVGQTRSALARHGLPPQALELEVTESLMVGDVKDAATQLAELRHLGITVALDDFGTGYSSMAMLHKLPLDVMKIDRSFVERLGEDEGAIATVRAIVSLARSMKLALVAEGIETAEQAAILAELHCDELQGYLYGKPLAPAQFEALPGVARREPALLPA